MGSGRGMNVLLSEIGLGIASILPQEAFMSGSFPQIVQSQAKSLSENHAEAALSLAKPQFSDKL
jgi:hypothetical protein